MKKVLLIAVALLLVSGAANAQFMGLYTAEDHSYWCATGTGFYPIEVWIMSLPGPLGIICNEFSLCYPANVIQSTVTWNDPIISVTLGDLPSGLSVCYIVCQYDWFWIAHQLCYVSDPTQTNIAICPHPEVGVYQIANCEDGYPTEPCDLLTYFFINYGPDEPECQGTATEDASWGAIKSLVD